MIILTMWEVVPVLPSVTHQNRPKTHFSFETHQLRTTDITSQIKHFIKGKYQTYLIKLAVVVGAKEIH